MTCLSQKFNLGVPVGSLDAYIYRVNQVPMLTAEEETLFANRFRNDGDVESARQLVLAHLRFVVRIARGYLGYGLPLGDLIQEGNVGLMKAVKRFDPSIGVRLVSFAVHWIKAEIHEFVILNWRIVKIATTKAQRKLFFNLRGKKTRLGWFNQDEVAEVAEALKVTPEEVTLMEQRLNAMDIAFDAHDNEDDDAPTAVPARYLQDFKSDPAYMAENEQTGSHYHDKLHFAMEKLDARSQDILQQRWLAGEKAVTLNTLAERYGVSAERVRQLEKNAMKKLKQHIEEA